MKAWIIKYWRKFLWLFASAEAKKARTDAEIKATIVQSWIDEGKKRGMDDAQARKWAGKKIAEQAEKNRRSGQLIGCTICHQRGVNHDTGGMRRNPDGSYRHQNCGG
jgi:hypothetical protein